MEGEGSVCLIVGLFRVHRAVFGLTGVPKALQAFLISMVFLSV